MKKTVPFAALLAAAITLVSCSGVKVDSEIMGAIREAAEKCTLDMRNARVDGPQADALKDMILNKKGVVASLPTLSAALNDSNPKVRVVANKFMYSAVQDNIGEFEKDLKKTPPAVVENLIKSIEISKDYVTFYSVAATTMLATMYSLENRLIAAIDKHPEKKELQGEMIKFLVRYGRLRVFPVIKAYAESGEPFAMVRVLDSFRDLRNWTEEERKTVGDWALTHLSIQDEPSRVRVIYALYLAGGSYYDKALDSFEAEVKAGNPTGDNILWLKNMGSTDTPAQKERRLALLAAAEKVAKKK
jgi:hypothetical protein